MMKHAPEWVRTSDPVIRSPARYRWTTAPAWIYRLIVNVNINLLWKRWKLTVDYNIHNTIQYSFTGACYIHIDSNIKKYHGTSHI